MEDQIGQIFIQLIRKSTRYTWLFIPYGLICLSGIFGITIFPEVMKETFGFENKFEVLIMLSQNFVGAVVGFLVFKLFSETSGSLVSKRHDFYQLAVNRINKIFEGRYSEPCNEKQKIYGEFQNIILYPYKYKRGKEVHQLDFDKFNFKIVDNLDTMYMCYSIQDDEKFYVSVWHAGNFLAVAIMLEKSLFDNVATTEDDFVKAFKRSLNIQDALNYDSLDFVPRGNYLMFDIKYDTDEMFLRDIIKQEELSRKVAHVATVGIPVMMKVLDWEVDNSESVTLEEVA